MATSGTTAFDLDIDEIIQEPIGGAHRDRSIILDNVKKALIKSLNYFDELDSDEIINERKNKLRFQTFLLYLLIVMSMVAICSWLQRKRLYV